MKKYFSFFLLHYTLLLLACVIARIVFLAFNLKHVDNNNLWELLQSFYYGIPLDLSLISYAFLPALLLFAIIKNSKNEIVLKTYYQIVATLVFSVNLIDTALFEHWGTRINIMALFYSQNMGGAIASVSIWQIILFIVLLILQLVLFHFIFKYLFQKASPFFNKPSLSIMGVFSVNILFILLAFLILRGGIGKVPINQSRVSYSSNNYLNASAINGLWNFIYYIANNKSSVKYEDFVEVNDIELEEFSNTNIDAGEKLTPSLFNKTDRPNIILLVMESLSSETLIQLGGHFDWSDGLNSQIENGLVFSNAYSSGNRTDKGLVSLLSGFPAQPTTSVLTEPSRAAKLPSVSCEFSSIGYSNTFIYGGDIGFANMGFYLNSSCFTKIIDQKNISSKTAKGSWGYHDQDVFSELKKQIHNSTSPFFITTLSLSVHEPFDIPNKKKNNVEHAYRYSDSCMLDFIEWFKKSENYKNTLLIITGDHGRDLEIEDKHYFDKYKFHVPFIFLGGALNEFYKGKLINNHVSQTAIMPFILQNMGMKVSKFEFYHNPINAKTHYVHFFFDNGLGFINNEDYFILSNPIEQIATYIGAKNEEDHTELIRFSRTYQQLVMKKYFALNHK